jgi:hypothetical protein
MRFQMTETYGSLDSLGQPYVTLAQFGPKAEGEAPVYGNDEKVVWAAYWDMFNAYCKKERATAVEWRAPPALVSEDGRHWVRSRLSVIEREAA